jgi:5-formyltetrahydrofolate cyclo-ligase
MITKSLLRKMALQYRQLLSEEEYQRRNTSLSNQLLELIRQKNFKAIHVFLPIHKFREPDFTALFPILWSDGRRIITTKTDIKSKTQTHFWLEPDTRIIHSTWGIPEPDGAVPVSINDADLIIVPLLLADKNGHRIGYGGGYYDRLLREATAYSVGVSLGPVMDELAIDMWDVELNRVISILY